MTAPPLAQGAVAVPGGDASPRPTAGAPIGPDGVYFHMPMSEYLAAPRLNASGIKQLLVHPLHYWAKTPWLNPDYEPEEDSPFTALGTAYHCRIVEGKAAFADRYAEALDPDAFPDALRTADDIKAALLVADPEAKKSGKKEDLANRLRAANPHAQIWDDLLSMHGSLHKGRTLLSHKSIRNIEIRARMIEAHPDLAKAFTGGCPEVTVFWTEDGVPMKARLDYLKPRAVVDLKTFGNPLEKPVDRAIVSEIATRKYFVQAALQMMAAERAAQFIAEGAVHDDLPDEGKRLVYGERQYLWVFQATGPAPIAKGVIPPRILLDMGKQMAADGINLYRINTETYGTDPWADVAEIVEFDSTMFPAWVAE